MVSSKHLKVCFFNARSIVNKLVLLNHFLDGDAKSVDILFITETWLHSAILDSMIYQDEYSLIRCDRCQCRGGGVLILYKSELKVVQFLPTAGSSTSGYCEFISVDVYNSSYCCRLSCFYIPPSTAGNMEKLKSVCNLIHICNNVKYPSFIFGDFNVVNVNWQIPVSLGGAISDFFVQFCNDNFLSQHINEPTHCNGNILDLLLCNVFSSVSLIAFDVCEPFCNNCDHCVINFKLAFDISTATTSNKCIPDFTKANYEFICSQLSIVDWFSITNKCNNSVQLLYDCILHELQLVIDKYVPTRTKGHKHSKPSFIKQLLKKKKTLYRKCKTDFSLTSSYKDLSKKYDTAVRQWYDELESSICENPNPKKFYGYVSRKFKVKSTIPPLKCPTDDQLAITDYEKANILNNVFNSVFKFDNGVHLDMKSRLPSSAFISDPDITLTDVIKAFRCLNDKLSRTPDGIPAYFLKRVAPSLYFVLLHLFRLSVLTSDVPEQWKTALVVPIFKKGSRCDPSNYRPISLTCVMCRVLEFIIADKMLDHLYSNCLLSDRQFGFLPGHSSCSQLLIVLQDWFKALDSGTTVDIVYTDIAKAFDTVSHNKLLQVLNSYGIVNNIYKWLESFLNNRSQQVVINDICSIPLNVFSGVPQGSVIGPILFIIFIDDIFNSCKLHGDFNGIFLYADDAKLYSNNPCILQSALNDVAKWIDRHQLFLAPNKCEHLVISRSNVITNHFSVNGTVIPSKSVIKDLGINISHNLKWSDHIAFLKSHTLVSVFQLLKSFSTRNVWLLLKAYYTYIRPKLEHNTVLWSPYLIKDIASLEIVQKRFTRIICIRCNIPFNSYADRLNKLNMKSLEYRRAEFDLMFMFKIFHNISEIKFNDYFVLHESGYNLRRNSKNISSKVQPKHDQFLNFYFNRICRMWNSLPEIIITAPSYNTFKMRLKAFDLHNCLALIY